MPPPSVFGRAVNNRHRPRAPLSHLHAAPRRAALQVHCRLAARPPAVRRRRRSLVGHLRPPASSSARVATTRLRFACAEQAARSCPAVPRPASRDTFSRPDDKDDPGHTFSRALKGLVAVAGNALKEGEGGSHGVRGVLGPEDCEAANEQEEEGERSANDEDSHRVAYASRMKHLPDSRTGGATLTASIFDKAAPSARLPSGKRAGRGIGSAGESALPERERSLHARSASYRRTGPRVKQRE